MASASPIDSMLSYVSGRDGKKGPGLFDKEVGSWLMMATELVPGIDPPSVTSPSHGLDPSSFLQPQETLERMQGAQYRESPFSLFSSFSPSQGVRRDSIDLLTLPDPVKPLSMANATPYPNDSILKDPNNTKHTSSLEHSAFFNSPTPFGGSIVQELVLPDPIPSPKSTRKRRTSSSPIDADLYEDEETAKKQRRLAKNREIAKNCRKRKKEKKAAILEEIQRLQEENEQLRQRLEDFSNESIENEHRNRVRCEFIKKMKILMESKDEETITKEIEEYYSRWSEFGAERLSAAQIHLEQLKMLLLPTQMTKLCLWSLNQEDEFF